MANQNDKLFQLCRRDFLRLLSGGAVAVAAGGLIVGCGGGSASSGRRFTPSGNGNTTGTVNASEVGGTGLMVQSVQQPNSPVTRGGGFNTTVSSTGTQLVSVTDETGALRSLSLSQPTLTNLTFDATSTAITLVFLTIGILTTDPTEGAKRISEIQTLNAFPALLSYLKQNLPTASLNALNQTSMLDSLKNACITEWQGKQAHGLTHLKASDSNSSAEMIAAFGSGSVTSQPIILTNAGWRTVYIVRQNLDSNNHEVLPQEPGFYVAGATGVSWGSLFTLTAGEASNKPDSDNLTSPTGISAVKYWINGPGQASNSETLGPGVDMSGSQAYVYSFVRYLLFPLFDLVTGGFSLLHTAEDMTKKVVDLVSSTFDSSGAVAALQSGNGRESVASLIDVVVGLTSTYAAIGGALGFASPLAATVAAALTVSGIGLSASNLSIVVLNWLTYPQNASVQVTVSTAGVIVT